MKNISMLLLVLTASLLFVLINGCSGGGSPDSLYSTSNGPLTSPGVIYSPGPIPPPFPTFKPPPSNFLPVNPLRAFQPMNITSESAVMVGDVGVYNDLFAFPTELGFEWQLSSTPLTGDWNKVEIKPSYQLGLVHISTGQSLSPTTNYRYRLYLEVKNPAKPQDWKSDPLEFTTLSPTDQVITVPIPPMAPMDFNPLTSLQPADLTTNSAILVGNVATYPVTDTRIPMSLCFHWGLGKDSPENWHTVCMNDSGRLGVIKSIVDGLTPNTVYGYKLSLSFSDGTDHNSNPIYFATPK